MVATRSGTAPGHPRRQNNLPTQEIPFVFLVVNATHPQLEWTLVAEIAQENTNHGLFSA
jgi:hypothetical protein